MGALNQGLSTSWALFWGVSVQEICSKATFARFYKLGVTAPLLAHSVLSVARPERDSGGCGVLVPSKFFHVIQESVAVTSPEDSACFSFR